ncbi:hypothetical protein OIU84_008983 [Salix udensis]|uniref:Uncharacterized protein n=1 Tax=Salix udensis TaxID=889485 RepID=A0AAD6NXW7_9ROSI|nr:hypothetical protein OIU84_008983 [Salix udensis]
MSVMLCIFYFYVFTSIYLGFWQLTSENHNINMKRMFIYSNPQAKNIFITNPRKISRLLLHRTANFVRNIAACTAQLKPQLDSKGT